MSLAFGTVIREVEVLVGATEPVTAMVIKPFNDGNHYDLLLLRCGPEDRPMTQQGQYVEDKCHVVEELQ